MPYKCVHCSELYEDGSKEVLTGCSKCSRKFFFYIKKDKLKEMSISEGGVELNEKEKDQIEDDVREIAGIENEETPVFLDFESVSIIQPGKYALDLGKLFDRENPKVYKLEDGKYVVDLVSKRRVFGEE